MNRSKLVGFLALAGGIASFLFFRPFGTGNALALGLCGVLVAGGFGVLAAAALDPLLGKNKKENGETP